MEVKAGQEPRGRNWCRELVLHTPLLLMAGLAWFLLEPSTHNGLGPPPSITNQGKTTKPQQWFSTCGSQAVPAPHIISHIRYSHYKKWQWNISMIRAHQALKTCVKRLALERLRDTGLQDAVYSRVLRWHSLEVSSFLMTLAWVKLT